MTGFTKNAPIYLDHAATTPLRKEVKKHLMEMLDGPFGNSSSVHQLGRKAKVIVEEARSYIAKCLNCTPAEITFTSGGTEADNAALYLAVRDLGVERFITSPIEHHAVLNTILKLEEKYGVEVEFVELHEDGAVDFESLEEILKEKNTKTMVSLMHGNNELGNILDLKRTANICKENDAYFHSDTVQTIGRYPLDLEEVPIDFLAASAHKFGGPKGVGFMFSRSGIGTGSYVTGGSQQRGLRGGTENTWAVSGLQKALQLSYDKMMEERAYIMSLKSHLINKLKNEMPDCVFNGQSEDVENSLCKVLSVSFPQKENDPMFLFQLDLQGICVSGGSACSSGSLKGSHVMQTVYPELNCPVIRFSFGMENTMEEIDYTVEVLKNLVENPVETV